MVILNPIELITRQTITPVKPPKLLNSLCPYLLQATSDGKDLLLQDGSLR